MTVFHDGQKIKYNEENAICVDFYFCICFAGNFCRYFNCIIELTYINLSLICIYFFGKFVSCDEMAIYETCLKLPLPAPIIVSRSTPDIQTPRAVLSVVTTVTAN